MAVDQTVQDPKGDSLLSRVVTPMVLLAPLTIGLLLFGVVYGRRSSQLATDIDMLASSLIVDSPTGPRIAPDRVCPDARTELADLTFYRLDPDDPSRKSSISGLGFDRGVIDLKGRLDDPAGETDPVENARPTATEDDASVKTGSDADSEPTDGGESITEGGTTAAASDPAAQDNRDDITLELRRSGEAWCVADVVIR